MCGDEMSTRVKGSNQVNLVFQCQNRENSIDVTKNSLEKTFLENSIFGKFKTFCLCLLLKLQWCFINLLSLSVNTKKNHLNNKGRKKYILKHRQR